MYRLILLTIFYNLSFANDNPSSTWTTISPAYYLNNRIPNDNRRYSSFTYALLLLEKQRCQTIVETGTARDGDRSFIGDGGSTIIFGDWASDHGAVVHSVDINPEAIANAERALGIKNAYVHLHTQDSVEWLSSFDEPIDFLYLDSFDFNSDHPQPSQEHHLKEIKAAYPLLHNKSIVMIDDCGTHYGGKGKLVIEYLLERGWKVVFSGYQVILAN